MQKDSGLESNAPVLVHTGPKSFAKYSFGQPKHPINYDPPHERLGYGHLSNDNVRLDYGPKSLNTDVNNSNLFFIQRDYSQKKGFNMNPSYYNHSNTKKDYYESTNTYLVPKSFATQKSYQTKNNISSKYHGDHYGNSVMWSYEHFEGTLRKPFNRYW